MAVNLRQLRYFVVLAEELHFRRAAERLHITQSPLTVAIQELERDLGGRLFSRTQRRVELTAAGRAFLLEARAILDKIEGAVEAARALFNGAASPFRLGLASAAALHPFLPVLLQRFRIAHPTSGLLVTELASQDPSRAFRSRELDACLLRLPLARPPSSHASLKLLSDPLVVAMHCDHPLRTKAKLVLADLKEEGFVSFPRSSGSGLFEALWQLCGERSFHPKIVQEAAEITTVLALTAAKLGIAVVPSSSSRVDVAGIVIVPLSDTDAVTEMHLAFPQVAPHSQVASLCRIAQATVRQFETDHDTGRRGLIRGYVTLVNPPTITSVARLPLAHS